MKSNTAKLKAVSVTPKLDSIGVRHLTIPDVGISADGLPAHSYFVPTGYE